MRWVVFIILAFVIWITFPIAKEILPMPVSRVPERTATPVANIESQKNSKNFKNNASEVYDYSVIDSHFESSRLELSKCFLLNAGNHELRMQLSMQWEGSGAFTTLELKPDLGSEVRQCLTEIIRKWPVMKHPSLKPFSYSRILELSGT